MQLIRCCNKKVLIMPDCQCKGVTLALLLLLAQSLPNTLRAIKLYKELEK